MLSSSVLFLCRGQTGVSASRVMLGFHQSWMKRNVKGMIAAADTWEVAVVKHTWTWWTARMRSRVAALQLLSFLTDLLNTVKVDFWCFSTATNTTQLFLIGQRMKHPCSQVWRKVKCGLRSTENFQNGILKMSLPSFSLVYHNGIMSLHFINCDLCSFAAFHNLLNSTYSANSYTIMTRAGRGEHEERWEFRMKMAVDANESRTESTMDGVWKEIRLDLWQMDEHVWGFTFKPHSH